MDPDFAWAIIEKNSFAIWWAILRFHNRKMVCNLFGSPEDLFQIAAIQMHYSLTRNISLAGYKPSTIAYKTVWWLVRRHRSNVKRRFDCKLRSAINLFDYRNIPFVKYTEVDSRIDEEVFSRYLRSLNARTKLIIERRYGFDGSGGKTQKEIGKELGITKARVAQLEKKALMKFPRHLIEIESCTSPPPPPSSATSKPSSATN